MEKQGYRESLARMLEIFPDRLTIPPQEAAEAMECNIKTVYSAISRVRNPLPAVHMTKKKIVIPLSAFARWLA